MARFGNTFKLVADDLSFNTSTKNLEMVEGNDSIPQTIDHFLRIQVGELAYHPNFGIDILGIMRSGFAHELMVAEIKALKEKLGFETFSYEVSRDGREASIEAQLRKK